MADQGSTYSRIYDLKTIGVDKVIGELNKVAAAFDKIAQLKKGVTLDVGDTGGNLTTVAASVTKLQSSYKEAADAAKVATEQAKQATEASKQAANAKVAEAKANLDNAKATTESSKQKEIENRLNERYLAQLQRMQKERDRATIQLEKEQTALFQLKQQYKEAAGAAEELGAQYVLLEREIRSLENIGGGNIAPGMTGDLQQKRSQLAALSPIMKDAQEKALGLHSALLQVEQAVGKSQRNVGNYNSAVMAMSQILREAPSFAYSFSTGLLAVSNNIPILVDEITRLKRVNEDLIAAGGKAIPIWKTLAGALTSPVGVITILTAALTILSARMTMSSGEMSKAEKAAQKYAESLKRVEENAYSTAAEEQAHAKALLSVAQNQGLAMDIRLNAVKELQEMYPNYLGNIDKEAILTGKVTEKVEELNRALVARAMMHAGEKKIGAAYEKIFEAEAELRKLDEEFARQLAEMRKAGADPNKGSEATYRNIEDRKEIFRKQIADAKKEAEAFAKDVEKYADASALLYKGGKDPKGKQPKDYTNEILQARRSELDALYEQRKIEVQIEAAKNKEIYDDETKSHEERLASYKAYMDDQRKLLEIETEKQIAEIDARLSEIERIKQKPNGERTPEQSTLLLSENALNEQRKVVADKWDLERLNQEIAKEKGITAMQKEEVQKRLDQIKYLNENSQIQEDAALKALRSKLDDGAISFEKYTKRKKEIEDKFQMERLQNLKKYLEAEIAAMRALGIDVSKANEMLAAVNHQISDLGLNVAERNAKKTQDIYKQSMDQLLQFTEQAGQAFFAAEAQRDNVMEQRRQRQLNQSKKAIDAQAQSLRERENNDKAFDLAQQQRESEKLKRDEQRAKAQMAFQFGIAVMKAVAAHAGDFGIGAAIEIGGMTAIYGAKLAFMESIPAYAEGTKGKAHPGGDAWVGDGYEHEFMKIGRDVFITPNVPTLVDMPAGAEVTPFSAISYSGAMGANLSAPSFYSSNTSKNSGQDFSDIRGAFSEINNTMYMVMDGLSNMKVTLDTQMAERAINNTYFKKVSM